MSRSSSSSSSAPIAGASAAHSSMPPADPILPGTKAPRSPRSIALRPWLSLLAGAVFAFVLHTVLHWSLSSSLFLSLLFAYLPSYLDGAQYKLSLAEGSRFWPALAHWRGWKWIMSYFPASITSEEYDYARNAANGAQFLFATHPHGLMSLDHFLLFTDSVGFLSRVAPLPRRDLGATAVFLTPLLREVCLWLGTVDASSSTARRVLERGYSMQLYPGGLQEQVGTDHSHPMVVARDRMGFLKLALQYDVPVVPVYCFGEDRLYRVLRVFRPLQRWLVRNLRLGLPFAIGRLDSFGVLPFARPLHAVVGAPLWPRGVCEETQAAAHKARCESMQPDRLKADKAALSLAAKDAKANGAKPPKFPEGAQPGSFFAGRRVPREVSQEELLDLHERYIRALHELFEKHKKKHRGYENATLEIRSARS